MLTVTVRRAAARVQARHCHRARAAQMREAGIDATVAFHEERKALVQEEYAYPDTREVRDGKFDARLETFQEIYEAQEMDGTVRYLMQKEVDLAEAKIYEMAVRSGRVLKHENQVKIHQRVEESRARLVRRYKGLDADLRSGDETLAHRAKVYLDRVGAQATENRWDHARAAHQRWGAELQGTPQQQAKLKAENEINGLPDATADTLKQFQEGGFLEREEFGMLRREVGEEVADEFVTKLQKARAEVTQKRLKALADRTKLHQLEKQLVLQEHKTVFDTDWRMKERKDTSAAYQDQADFAEEDIETFVRERDISGEEGLNTETHEMTAEVRRQRMEILKAQREGQEVPEYRPHHFNSTTGLVQNPRNFVDSDWWELASADPNARRSYKHALKRDMRSLKGAADAVTARKQTADGVLGAMERFNDFRKDRHNTGYSKSQVLAYDDYFTNEPLNTHVEQVLGKQMLRNDATRDEIVPGYLDGGSKASGDAAWAKWLHEADKMKVSGRQDTGLPGV
eukprot:TRINITY_DN7325_c0_g1_i1.p1 TRINITY_DN7325_c0_g1~~TRINITY_DN7325_c0_g1_i1.p1  ORF type:complete len:513 (+),score=214.72 TRINITY_DN7325_c0_g1_i1:83-1621(+)